VGQIISVPGTAAERRIVTAIASNTSLTVSAAYAYTASGQTCTRVNSGIVAHRACRVMGGVSVSFASTATLGNYRNVALQRVTADAATYVASQSLPATGGGEPTTFAVALLPCSMAQWDFIECIVKSDGNNGSSQSPVSTGSRFTPEFTLVEIN
jgi:hypothetical protein